MIRSCFFHILFIALAVSFSGCVTTGGYIQTDYSKVSQLKEADQLFEKGNYGTALLKYTSYVYSPFPDKQYEEYAEYKLGLCQFLLGQYNEADKTIQSLLDDKKDFEYRKQAEELRTQCQQKISEKNQIVAQQQTQLQQTIQNQQQTLSQKPESAEDHYQLGNLYWNAGRFQDAVKEYERAAHLDSSYLQKKNLLERVRITQNGEFRVRDPLIESVEKPKPVRVAELQPERIVRSNFLGQVEGLRLSGYVENSGLYDVSNVRVEIVITDFFGKVQETQSVLIGQLAAGAKRPFSAMFSQYKGLAFDQNYKAEVYYDEPAGFGQK